jgi:hypothetical protein
MEISRIDNVARVVEQTTHDSQEQPQRRHQRQKREKIPSSTVYKANGQLEEEPPPNIDVLV